MTTNIYAGYTSRVEVSTNQTDWIKLAATSPSLEVAGNLIDSTTIENRGWKESIDSLFSWTISCDSLYKYDSENPFNIIRKSKLNRSDLYARFFVHRDHRIAMGGLVRVDSFSMSAGLEGITEVAISLQGSDQLKGYDRSNGQIVDLKTIDDELLDEKI